MTKKLIFGILGLLVVVAMMTPSLVAQSSTTGDVTGTVTDASGAVVPNAAVTLKSDAEGSVLTQQTNSQGVFRFSLLKPGSYTLSVKAAGMQASDRRVSANVGEIANVPIKMGVGGSVTTVEVTEVQPMIQTENADMETGYSLSQITSLPTPGNDITSYAYSSPGVVVNTGSGYGNFSSFGLPSTANLFTTNGNDNMDPYLNLNNSGASNLALGANELQEVAVVNNGYTAEYGRQAGTQMNATTKSGTNQYHGNASYWWNGRTLNANDWFGNHSDPITPRPFANNNQYAASFGGPIIKDKLFFFADQEGLRYVLPGAGGAVYIPTTNFANYVLATVPAAELPFYQNIFNVYGNAPGANRASNVTTADDPSGAYGCGDFAGTAGFGTASTPCARTFRSTQNNLNTEWLLSTRVDWNISNKDRFNIRFRTDHGVQATGTDPINAAFNANSVQPEYEGQINETHVFSPTMVNNFILSGMWYSAIFGPPNFAQALKTFPTEMQFADGLFTTLGGGDFGYPQGRIVTQYMFTDDFSLTKGNHTFKFGANFRRNLVSDYTTQSGISGLYTLGSMTEFTQGLFDPLASNYTQNVPKVGAVQTKLYNLGLFAQDQWKVSPKLNVTLALRVDNTGNPGCKQHCYNRLVAPFDSLTHDVNVPYNSVIKTGLGQAFQGIQSLAWGPRIGVAYSITPTTVFRGGFGIFSDLFPGTVVDRFINNAPNVFTATPTNAGPIAFGAANPGNPQQQAFQSAAAFQQGFAGGATLAQLQAILPGFGAPTFSNMSTQIKMPQFMEWNAQFEQAFTDRYSLSLNYVGNHGYNIMTVDPFSNAYCRKHCLPNGTFGTPSQGILPGAAPDPRFAQVNSIYNQGYANYNGLTSTFKMRFSSAFQANFNYSWSHSLDTCSNNCLLPFSANTVVSLRYTTSPLLPGSSYGSSDYDVRQNFNANYVWNTKSNWSNKAVNGALGNWVVAGTIYFHSGYPWSPVSTSVRSNLGNVTGLRNGTPLADFLGGPVNVGGCSNPDVPCVLASQFATGATQSDFGNLARNSLRGAGYFDTDLNITKNIPIGERLKFSIGANFFNLFNHPNFDLPINSVTNGAFGLIQTTVEPATTPYGAFSGTTLSGRIVQLNARVTF